MVCPITINEVPVNPPKIRNAVNMGKLIAAAVPAEHPHSTKTAMLYEMRRPTKRLMGPQISEEKPMANNTPALMTLRISSVVLNRVAISGVAGSNEVLLKVTARVIHETMNRMMDLCQKGRS